MANPRMCIQWEVCLLACLGVAVVSSSGSMRRTATVLEMLTGMPPFADTSGMVGIYNAARNRQAPSIPVSLSADAQAFLRACLAYEPTDRPSPRELLSHAFIASAVPAGSCPSPAFATSLASSASPAAGASPSAVRV